MGGNVQVVWEKFANYWEVEPRYVPLEGDVFHLTADRLLDYVDENTIGVVAVLGSTMDGTYEPVAGDLRGARRVRGGQRGGRAGARRRRVGRLRRPVHPAGPGVGLPAATGWCRSSPPATSSAWSTRASAGWSGATPEYLPEDLVFHVNYLGGDMPTFALNFSRPGAQVVLQYFQFLRLGREGYRLVQQTCQDVAVHIVRGAGARCRSSRSSPTAPTCRWSPSP